MAIGKEIRGKIKSVENTMKITKAMEMVATSKMRKTQARMRAARPFSDKARSIASHLADAHPDYRHPFMEREEKTKRVGIIVVTTDKGLCGGMNMNILRLTVAKLRELHGEGIEAEMVAIGSKGAGFLKRIGAKVVGQAVQLGDTPHLSKVIGPVSVLLDAYRAGRLDAVYLFYTRFINTMSQQPTMEQLIPLPAEHLHAEEKYAWDYLYEPDPQTVIDALLEYYIESLIYHGVAENMASEQAARRMAMKAATDNAGTLIAELKLLYNKQRQAAITKEISEIVSGAAAV